MARRRRSRFLEKLLYLAGFVLLGIYGLAQLDAGLYEAVQSRRLALMLRAERVDEPSPEPQRVAAATRAEARRSGLVGRLEIERLGVSAIVSEGIDSRTLRRAIGHLPETALPGEDGNVVLAGHRDSFFRGLRDVRPGDRVAITTPDGTFDYEVKWAVVVEPEQIEVAGATRRPSLTLITCYPFDYVGPAPQRFVVRALALPPAADA